MYKIGSPPRQETILTWTGSTGDQEGSWPKPAASIARGRIAGLPSPPSGRVDVIICGRGGFAFARPLPKSNRKFLSEEERLF